MQSLCAYETAYIGMSDFCGLFTQEEWEGFEQTLDIGWCFLTLRAADIVTTTILNIH